MLPLLLLALAAPIEPGRPIADDAPWAVAPDDGPRTLLEQATGKRVDPRTVPRIREGDMVFSGESLAVDQLKAMGAPLPALDHPPTPGILILAMDGVTIKPNCGGPQDANGALNCSPLVDSVVDFPAAGNDQTKSAIFQAMLGFYNDFDLVISTSRPPEWVPYTLSVIGGTSGLAGHENGVCGIANVACDGAKRNHVSLTFSQSCPGDAALTAGQETAHNWGLEHTDVQSDIMYPFVVGAGKFQDMCMDISHATGSGTTQCTYVHELYCPEGQGEQQNSYGELMGVFGPKKQDTTKPTIVSISPADGSQFTSKDSITVTATLADDSNFLGVKWDWLEGRPDAYADGYNRCTNQVCTDDFNAWKPIDEPYDLITLKSPPAGHYSFKLEAMDAYGNYVTQTIAFDVVEGGETSESATSTATATATASDATGDESASAGDTDTPTSGATSGDEPTGGDATDATNATSATSATNPSGGGSFTNATNIDTMDEGDEEGCACRSSAPPAGLALLLALGLVPRRRRR